MTIRTRFAPSPTGNVHIGNMRAAIFNWLYARHTGGQFLLRIEDTDIERSTPQAIEALLQAMDWLGLDYDEEPLYQTTRMQAHLDAAEQLLASGHAYKEDKGGLGQGECVIFKMPDEDMVFDDEVKGTLRKKAADTQDFVIVRSNGTPVFHLANVLDDIEQGITHVIRGDDHVENTYRHIALYKALGATVPKFAHLPMIINAQGKPYSKRDGDAFVGDFKEKGFLGETLFNYLALLGWSPGDDREVMTRDEMIAAFDLKSCKSSPAQVDLRKLQWMNGEYVRQMPQAAFDKMCSDEFGKADVALNENATAAFALLQPRVKLPSEIVPQGRFLFEDDYEYDEKAVKKKLLKDGVFQTLEKIAGIFQTLPALSEAAGGTFDEAAVDKALHDFVEESGLGFGGVMQPLRIAVSGQQSGPDLAPVLAVLGKEKVLARIQKTIERFK
jgi:glutamyl-tRNA synthetase